MAAKVSRQSRAGADVLQQVFGVELAVLCAARCSVGVDHGLDPRLVRCDASSSAAEKNSTVAWREAAAATAERYDVLRA